jgi:hypothetical protein
LSIRESEAEWLMDMMKMEQPTWSVLLKLGCRILLIGGIFTLAVFSVNSFFEFIVKWIAGVI